MSEEGMMVWVSKDGMMVWVSEEGMMVWVLEEGSGCSIGGDDGLGVRRGKLV
jgi:hypothetical protein